MAHYAFIDDNDIVVEVIVGIDETELIEGKDTEAWYAEFRGLKCVRTSFNGKIRGKYAGLGDTYSDEEDIFIAPQPYPSWTRQGSWWKAPKPYPQDKVGYVWSEEIGDWIAA
jgi:hypothetical protein